MKTRKNNIIKYTTILILTGLCLMNCSAESKTFSDGYTDIHKLIEDFSEAVFKNDRDTVTKLLVNRKEYRKLIHPFVPEGDMKHGGMKADEFWRTFIVQRRDAVIGGYLSRSKDFSCKLVKIGVPKKVVEYPGKLKFHREYEITYTCENSNGQTESDQRLFGVIAEKSGKYKVLNSFGD